MVVNKVVIDPPSAHSKLLLYRESLDGKLYARRHPMTSKKTRLEPSRKASGDPKKWAKRAREFSERLAASGRTFSDSTEIIRADRDSRT